MRTFISYHASIKRTAGKIKKYLDRYDFNCFLAHEDIIPQATWPSEIQNGLEECDLFLPLITEKFKSSFFCQQETGFAYCRNIEILPVMISESPMGMISHLQAVNFRKTKIDESCLKIVLHVAKNTTLSEPVIDALIQEFGDSSTYQEANERAELILNEFDFTTAQLKNIKRYIENKNQIYETKHARDCIFEFMDRYPKIFNDKFRDRYDEKSRRWM